MSEKETQEWIWQCAMKHVVAAIEGDAATWTPNSPARATADFFANKFRRMPAPVTAKGEPQ
jgi:hypothetical protein